MRIDKIMDIEATVIGAIVVVFAVVMLAIEITQPARERAAYEEGYCNSTIDRLVD